MEMYLAAKFRWDNSIHGWDKTTSVFGKWTAAILEFYYRFRLWRTYIVIGMSFYICLPNFLVIGRSAAELWRHIHFFKMTAYSRKCTSGFRFSDGIWLRMWKSICRFRKTDGRHIGILFPVSISTYVSLSACYLHLLAKCGSNQTIVGGVMTS